MALRDVAQNFYDFFALKNKISVFLQIKSVLYCINEIYSLLNQLIHNGIIKLLEKYKFRTYCVQALFWMSKQKKTIFVHNMLWTFIFFCNSMSNLLS